MLAIKQTSNRYQYLIGTLLIYCRRSSEIQMHFYRAALQRGETNPLSLTCTHTRVKIANTHTGTNLLSRRVNNSDALSLHDNQYDYT